MSAAAQNAVVMGTQYTWNREAFHVNASILWRTNHDHDRATGFSGSVLCLGKPTDKVAKAVVFQNFESPVKPWEVLHDHRQSVSDPWNPTFKGGFLLPEDIRNAKIRTIPNAQKHIFGTVRAWTNRSSQDSDRRVVTGP
jgi:hypothetical protein